MGLKWHSYEFTVRKSTLLNYTIFLGSTLDSFDPKTCSCSYSQSRKTQIIYRTDWDLCQNQTALGRASDKDDARIFERLMKNCPRCDILTQL